MVIWDPCLLGDDQIIMKIKEYYIGKKNEVLAYGTDIITFEKHMVLVSDHFMMQLEEKEKGGEVYVVVGSVDSDDPIIVKLIEDRDLHYYKNYFHNYICKGCSKIRKIRKRT